MLLENCFHVSILLLCLNVFWKVPGQPEPRLPLTCCRAVALCTRQISSCRALTRGPDSWEFTCQGQLRRGIRRAAELLGCGSRVRGIGGGLVFQRAGVGVSSLNMCRRQALQQPKPLASHMLLTELGSQIETTSPPRSGQMCGQWQLTSGREEEPAPFLP